MVVRGCEGIVGDDFCVVWYGASLIGVDATRKEKSRLNSCLGPPPFSDVVDGFQGCYTLMYSPQ